MTLPGGSTMKHRSMIVLALALAACAAVASSATAAKGGHGRLFQFRGELVAATATSVQVQVEAGNRPALRATLGQSQNQTFTIGPNTEILVWRKGIPAVASYTDLKPGDWVNVNVRDRAGSSLADLEATPAGIVGDRVKQPEAALPLWLYVGTVA